MFPHRQQPSYRVREAVITTPDPHVHRVRRIHGSGREVQITHCDGQPYQLPIGVVVNHHGTPRRCEVCGVPLVLQEVWDTYTMDATSIITLEFEPRLAHRLATMSHKAMQSHTKRWKGITSLMDAVTFLRAAWTRYDKSLGPEARRMFYALSKEEQVRVVTAAQRVYLTRPANQVGE